MDNNSVLPPITVEPPPANPLLVAVELQQAGKLAEAENLFRQILVVAPTNPVALYSLTVMAMNAGHGEDALRMATLGTQANPDFPQLWFALGTIKRNQNQREEALQCFDKALALDPRYLEVWVNSGVLLRDMRRHVEALERFRQALEVDPEYETALGNYGILLTEFKQTPQAILAFERLLKKNPNFIYGLGLLCFERLHVCDWTDFDEISRQITAGIRAGKSVCKTLAYMALSDSAADHGQCARIFAKNHHSQKCEPLWNGERYQHSRLRVAYVSPDLREHPVGHLMAGIIEAHDRTRVETIGVSLGIDDGSRIRARMLDAFDHFIDAQDLPARRIAEIMREMEVDVAVDLAGYTSDSRTEIFLHRPAPVQVNYLGYAATMGLSCYDYILADRTVIPEDHHQFYTEKVAYLDHSYLPMASGIEIAEPQPRSAYCLPDQGFVFCAFSHDFKIHPQVFAVWMRLLQAHEGSVLWLMSRNDISQQNLRLAAHEHGVEPNRLVFGTRVPRIEDHLARYRVADLFLDTWPYNAHTTASDALFAGLPVITYQGNSFPSRVAAGLLATFGLDHLAAHSLDEYFALADNLARDPEQLRLLKERLAAENRRDHPYVGANFARSLEKSYERFVADLPAAPLRAPVTAAPESITKATSAPAANAKSPSAQPHCCQSNDLATPAPSSCQRNDLAAFAAPSCQGNDTAPLAPRSRPKQAVIVIPAYRPAFNLLEQFSIDYLVPRVPGRKLVFIMPRGMDRTYYQMRYPTIEIRMYEDRFFESIIGYNHLLLNEVFYQGFAEYDYMLIHQSDALLFHDNLEYWMQRGFDYIGAPWPNGVEISLKVGKCARGNGVNLKSYVGNGGFSLRSISGTIGLLRECDDIRNYWITCGSSEDLFFAFAGMVADGFSIPNQMIASRFALELEAANYFSMNNEEIPTGCHAWWKHDLEFWKKIIARVG
jgi:predicted O-linked N-acetylglucosamine transferase (SPINDLY family)